MTNLIKDTLDLANQFMQSSRYVKVFDEGVEAVAKQIQPCESQTWPMPASVEGTYRPECSLTEYELMACAINYCYWYGKGEIRPHGSSSTAMYKALDHAWIEGGINTDLSKKYDALYKRLRLFRFPLVEERIRHLEEVRRAAKNGMIDELCEIGRSDAKGKVEKTVALIVENLSGFAADMFLKRTFLFLIQMYRRVRWFANEIELVPVPADYQIPKVLNHYGALYYDPSLRDQIANENLIPAGSIQECEIRAATIVACQRIAEKANVSMARVDEWLWTQRKICTGPFHLTITANY